MMSFSYKENFIEILCAKKIADKQSIHEASLGRIMHHVENANETGFAILTSYRQNWSKKENIKNFNQLKSDIRTSGFGYNQIIGHWRECQDPEVAYEDCPEEELTDAIEPSLFVMGIDAATAHEFGNKWEQDAVVYAGPEFNGNVVLIFRDGNTLNIGEFKPSTITQAFSKLKSGRTFAFEHFSWPTQNKTEAMIEQVFRNKPLSLISKTIINK
jgi:hypothetical protein